MKGRKFAGLFDVGHRGVGAGSGSSSLEAGRGCQHDVDVKGLKGRGVHRAVAQARADVDSIVAEMLRLVRVTRERGPALLYLCIHKRAGTEQHSVRWRAAGREARHLSWDSLRDVLKDAHSNERAFYLGLDLQARELNQREKVARNHLKHLRAMANLREHVAMVHPTNERDVVGGAGELRPVRLRRMDQP